MLLNNISLSKFLITEVFTGELDGRGNTISSLSSNHPRSGIFGIFSYNRGTIKNLTKLMLCASSAKVADLTE